MKVVLIGGSGHIGTYLVPRLVENGFEVVSVSRGKSRPYKTCGMWKWVNSVSIDREEEEKNGTFGKRISELYPDIVIDPPCRFSGFPGRANLPVFVLLFHLGAWPGKRCAGAGNPSQASFWRIRDWKSKMRGISPRDLSQKTFSRNSRYAGAYHRAGLELYQSVRKP